MRNEVVTVFGGTGFLGRQLVQRLGQHGTALRVVTRDPDRAGLLRPMGDVGQIAPLPYAEDEAGLRLLIEGSTGVVNLLGILHERRAGEFEHVHRDMAGRIAATAAATGVRRLVHVSAIGADLKGEARYARSKAEGEAAVRAAFADAAIIRPSIMFGPGDGFFSRFARMSMLSPVLPLIEGGRTKFQPVHVGDVVDAITLLLEQEAVAGQLFELGGPRIASFEELLRYILQVLNRRRLLLPVPGWLATLQARLCEHLPNPPLTRDQLLLLKKDNVVSGSLPGLADLGIHPTPLEAVVPLYLRPFSLPPRVASAA